MELKICQHLITQAFDPLVSPTQVKMAGQLLNPSDTMSAEDSLLIYRHSITGAQQRVLEMVYPICLRILGDTCFNNLGRDYAWGPHSNCNDLNQYGEGFADMLEEQLPSHPALNELLYLPDLARLEWAWQQSQFTADDPVFDPSSLRKLIAQYGEQLIPQASHSLFMLDSPWPVHDIWQAHTQGDPIDDFMLPDDTQHLVISRNEGVTIENVPLEIYHFLQHSQNGLALCEIVDRLGVHAEAALQQLPMLINKGWLCGFWPLSQET